MQEMQQTLNPLHADNRGLLEARKIFARPWSDEEAEVRGDGRAIDAPHLPFRTLTPTPTRRRALLFCRTV
jgi:hypothetical protein